MTSPLKRRSSFAPTRCCSTIPPERDFGVFDYRVNPCRGCLSAIQIQFEVLPFQPISCVVHQNLNQLLQNLVPVLRLVSVYQLITPVKLLEQSLAILMALTTLSLHAGKKLEFRRPLSVFPNPERAPLTSPPGEMTSSFNTGQAFRNWSRTTMPTATVFRETFLPRVQEAIQASRIRRLSSLVTAILITQCLLVLGVRPIPAHETLAPAARPVGC